MLRAPLTIAFAIVFFVSMSSFESADAKTKLKAAPLLKHGCANMLKKPRSAKAVGMPLPRIYLTRMATRPAQIPSTILQKNQAINAALRRCEIEARLPPPVGKKKSYRIIFVE